MHDLLINNLDVWEDFRIYTVVIIYLLVLLQSRLQYEHELRKTVWKSDVILFMTLLCYTKLHCPFIILGQ